MTTPNCSCLNLNIGQSWSISDVECQQGKELNIFFIKNTLANTIIWASIIFLIPSLSTDNSFQNLLHFNLLLTLTSSASFLMWMLFKVFLGLQLLELFLACACCSGTPALGSIVRNVTTTEQQNWMVRQKFFHIPVFDTGPMALVSGKISRPPEHRQVDNMYFATSFQLIGSSGVCLL